METRAPVWDVTAVDPAVVRTLIEASSLHPTVATILAARGIVDPEGAAAFLAPSLERDWPDESDIPGLTAAADRVAAAIERCERICVFGDFDLDGISAAALTVRGLQQLGAHVEAIVPHRFREGYGLTAASIGRIIERSPDLVVTVDCGISSVQEVETLRARGIDVVVTDHHEPGDGVPREVPVADPKLIPDGPELAGAGVALALVRACGMRRGRPDLWRDLVDLATLGTIADIVPMLGANRALVVAGLERMRAYPRAGIAALASVAGVTLKTIGSEQVSYAIAPRLNAAGRMDDPAIALEILLTEDEDRALALAASLDEHNRSRQSVESELLERALEQSLAAYAPGDRMVLVAGEGWHEGVRGIVASRLVARFGVPALVFSVADSTAEGSGRSIPGVDLHAALEAASELLDRYGGHAGAVGLALDAQRLDDLRAALESWFRELPGELFGRRLRVDAFVSLEDVTFDLANALASLEPHGFANPRPVLATRGVFLTGQRVVGRSNEHLAFTAYDGVTSRSGVLFRAPDLERLLSCDHVVDLAFEVNDEVFRGERRLRIVARDVAIRDREPSALADELVEELFAHAEDSLAREEYAGIAEADLFHTKLVGVTFDGRQGAVARLEAGAPLTLRREPDNPHDANAIAVDDARGAHLGYLNRRLAAVLAPHLDAGLTYDVEVTEVTGRDGEGALGVNVRLVKRTGDREGGVDPVVARAVREELESLDGVRLDERLRHALIGDRPLHHAQAQALANLAEGLATFAVMATGRGKSLIFQLHALRRAIRDGRASVFVYPLRALVTDQAFHLHETFAQLGVRVVVLTGETAAGERDLLFEAIARQDADVVLTTPEFLVWHAQRFAGTGRIGFVAIDEAHHIASKGARGRSAYARLGEAIVALGGPHVLATSATASDEVCERVIGTLGIERLVLDPSVRDNLRIDDRRGVTDRDTFLASLAARGEKTVVYVNSRDATVRLARMLRQRVPSLRHAVAFYHGGVGRAMRHAIEAAFRDGSIRTVVATSAFGEGVNIPDVRHVVLYHLPFSAIEFNQLCGRCGRDGQLAHVHLLYSEKDARINRAILASLAPERDDLAALYVVLRGMADQEGAIACSNAELAAAVRRRRPTTALDQEGVSVALGILRELSLIASEGAGAHRTLRLLPAPDGKLELTSSVRYEEGHEERSSFETFCSYALQTSASELLHAFNRPILPARPVLLDSIGDDVR